jgi:PAS domain S-box-containing protein
MTEISRKSGDQQRAEAEVASFHRHLGPFVVAAETTRMPMAFTNAIEPGNPIIFANDSFLHLTGYKREEVMAKSFDFLLEEGADAEMVRKFNLAIAGTSNEDPEIHYQRKDGSEFSASLFVSPVRNADGKIIQHFISLQDLTKKQAEVARALMFIGELNHRVKNTLATVQSVVWQAFRSGANAEDTQHAIESRLFALARSHDLLTESLWEGVGLHDLINAVVKPLLSDSDPVERLAVSGANMRLSPNACLALAIGFHELATNAVRYGALSNERGAIKIDWRIEQQDEQQRLILNWLEKDGPATKPPTYKGFGLDVIERGLPHELEGEVNLEFRPDGLCCTMNLPIGKSFREG